MKSKVVLVVALITTLLFSCKKEEKNNNLPDGLYAEIETNKGTIIVELNYKKTPMTVANFVSLAEGKNTRVTEEFKGKPFYDGLKFHRVISKTNGDSDDFMVQTGDPLGTGSGDAGYKFSDEITDLNHDTPGILSMANSGPGTNSSQFFITIVPTPWLDGKHTVFGKVVQNGMEVVTKIVQGDFIKSVKIIRNGKEAENFNANKIFDDQFKLKVEAETKLKAPYVAMINNAKATGTKLPSGLIYKVIQPGSGNKPAAGTTVNINYAGFLEDGTLFDSSIKSVEEKFGKYNTMKDQQNGYSPIPFQIGTKEGLIPGFIEAIEQMKIGEKAVFVIPPQLGYGAQGAGNVIPPNATIVFELEMQSK
ncbi:peptidylprolyl isomerase [Flavobacterium sp.]|uniref:peptidylprolyl isomerase n=1 Tax=Flavobacterium sp. TaxID=239 RepID=UPI002B4B3572|nr:peptidylprolyl isomerase [Flavobacterium sp.]HLP65398.1 peptidylprolyl isomerase [Flavobacterium sp.]